MRKIWDEQQSIKLGRAFSKPLQQIRNESPEEQIKREEQLRQERIRRAQTGAAAAEVDTRTEAGVDKVAGAAKTGADKAGPAEAAASRGGSTVQI
jgi:hypothetical protein